MIITRRQFLKGSLAAGGLVAAGGLGVFLTPRKAHAFVTSMNLQKFIQPLRGIGGAGIPVMVPDAGPQPWWQPGVTHFTIGISQFTETLHPSLPPTTLWGFGQGAISNYRHLGGIIPINRGTPVQITFQNNLPATHIIPVDASIPGANQAQNRAAVHVHGSFVPWISDGGPHDWWAPDGTHGLSFLNNAVLNPTAALNEAEYYYPNDQSARLLWYHDHAWGITRINAYAGVATGYVITDAYEAALTAANNLPGPLDPRTFYLIFQDKTFVDAATIGTGDPTWPGPTTTGSLWYPHVYDPARWTLGPTPGGPPPDPSAVPEAFGDTILVNGTVYPFAQVEQRQYRFRLLNACNARFLNPRLLFANNNNPNTVASTEANVAAPGPEFLQIGTEGGFLPHPTLVNAPGTPLLLLAPAERADVIVDFRNVPAGSILILYSDAAAPYPVGDPRYDFRPNNASTPTTLKGFGPNTRTLLQIRVVARVGAANPPITLPRTLTPTDPFLINQGRTPIVPVPNPRTGRARVRLANGTVIQALYRYLTLNEDFDTFGRLIQLIGNNVAPLPGGGFGRAYMDIPTETPAAGDYEVWELINLTGDTHPIHIHLVNWQILSRQPFDVVNFTGIPTYTGPAVAPDPNERGWKETVRMNPGEVTRVFAKFDLPVVPFAVPTSPRLGPLYPGKTAHEYVYHCHILEHEEHDMMRPLVVLA
jgi:spore coat protein A, manganese oxidase